jgi:hypothetical protein
MWVGLHLRWLQIGLHPWIMEAAANLPQQWRQQHWQLRHWLLRWRWQCGSSSGGLHPNRWGYRALPGPGRRCAQASPSWLALCPCSLRYALVACATPSQLALRACSLGFALAAWLCPCGSRYALAAWAVAAAAAAAGVAAVEVTAANACPRGSRYALAGLGFALAAWLCLLRSRGSCYTLAARLCPNTTIKQQSSDRKSCFGSAAAYLPQR